MIGVASWETSSLPPGSTQANLPFQRKKEQSHEIYQIFRPTTCTLIGVANIKRDCLMKSLEYRADTIICVSPQSSSTAQQIHLCQLA
jgi:hypothetical protein